MQRIAVLSFLLAFLPACSALQSASTKRSDAEVAQARFERLKSLAGEWTGPGPEEMHGAPMEVRYRVTAAGNAVEETLMPGSDHEMVTMYHLDGGKLMLTHYCAVGNQPRMVAAADGNLETIHFEFAGASNLASPNAGHMHEMVMTMEGKDRLKTRWTYYEDGKPGHVGAFDLTRKSGGA